MNVTNIPLFPCVLTQVECENYYSIRNELISWIYEFQRHDEGTVKSNRGGWQSKNDKFFFEPSFAKYYDFIFRHIMNSLPYPTARVGMGNMWININLRGDYNEIHDHPDSLLSGVFWIKIPENSGVIEFKSPKSFPYHFLYQNAHPQLKKECNYDISVQAIPREGTILLFPSDLEHKVTSNESNEDRISIAFNLNLYYDR